MAVRLAIISSPRSGNTWLRALLSDAYAIPEMSVHNPADADWSSFPPECVLQIHWHPTASFVDLLEAAGFRVVTLMRHPLDVLLSILQFCQHDRATLRVLDGEGGNERSIYGAMPCSAAFAEYATGPRATALLSVSVEWWSASDVCQVRYEDLVAHPGTQLARIAQAVGEPFRHPAAEVADNTTMAGLRTRFRAEHHFWQGRPGHWKTLLTAPAATRIAQAQSAAFACGYVCDPDPALTAVQADANWVNLVGCSVADKLYNLTWTSQRLLDTQKSLQELQGQRAALERALLDAQESQRCAQAELPDLRRAYREACDQLHRFQLLGPLPLACAWKLRNLSHSFPGLSAATKYTLRVGAGIVGLGGVLCQACGRIVRRGTRKVGRTSRTRHTAFDAASFRAAQRGRQAEVESGASA